MNRKRIGFLTTSGTIAAVMTVVIVAVFGLFSGGILFNPGPLNAKVGASLGGVTSHAELTNQCNSCHAPFWDKAGMAQRCEDCHQDVSIQWNDKATLHGNLHQNSPALTCRNCHPEHRGANAALTDMTKVAINHDAFGYSLKAHQAKADSTSFACSDCHGNNFLQFDQAICGTCHAQSQPDFMKQHVAAYGETCLNCHDGIDTYGHAFDHSLAAFKLAGKHASVACAQCHTGEPTIAAMKATAQDCFSCHEKDDAHSGQLGPDCASCHTASGWLPSTYDHNTSIFKLTGKHTLVACQNCHLNNIFKGTPTDCNSCHAKDDAHQGDLGKDCGSCHTTAGWLPATFDHNLSVFKLTGKHLLVACANCHINNVFKGTPKDCVACHKKDDVHQSLLGAACSACHTTGGWVPSTFNHNSSTFKLTGKHASVGCTGCHQNKLFKGTPSDCNSCHAGDDAHSGQLGGNCGSCHTTNGWSPSTFDHNSISFKLTGKHSSLSCSSCHTTQKFNDTPSDCHSCHAKDDAHAGQFGSNCGTCHSTSAWLPATFDHNISSFKLIGKHATVSCGSCHVNGVFKGTPTNCYACHAKDDAHSGQFGSDCGSCHSPNGWKPASFDHNKFFPLTGAHGGLSCNSCHTNGSFSGLSSNCSSCHADPAFHAGLFSGMSCNQCHNTSAWTPASYNLSHPGGCDGNCLHHENATCRDCHTTNLSTATCTKCHNGTPGGGNNDLPQP